MSRTCQVLDPDQSARATKRAESHSIPPGDWLASATWQSRPCCDVSTVPTCVWYQLSHLQANQARTPCDTPPQLEILPVIYTDCRSVPDRRQSYSAAPSLSRDTYLHNSQLEAWAAMTSPVVFRLSLRLAPAHPNLKKAWGLINSWTAAQPTWHSVLH